MGADEYIDKLQQTHDEARAAFRAAQDKFFDAWNLVTDTEYRERVEQQDERTLAEWLVWLAKYTWESADIGDTTFVARGARRMLILTDRLIALENSDV